MEAIKNVLSPFGFTSGAIQDTLKLVVIGGTVETVRRVSSSAWTNFVDSFFLTAHFSQEDYPYDWLMHWLAKQPAWARSREFEITTRSAGRTSMQTTTAGDLDDEDEDEAEDDDALVHGRRRRKVALMPSVDTTHTIYYRGHWLRITRSKKFADYNQYQELTISVVARSNSILKKLVLEAKREYEKDAEHRVHIFMADVYGSWRWNGARQKRPMSSIVLEPGVKEMLISDCRDFLRSEDWYAERGIPFRRGYLLHGVPGSGKTSLIHSLAGELGLDIYVVSLSSKGMSDNTLNALMGRVPSRCILLLEDLDAAFTRSVTRDATSTGAPTPTTPASTSTTVPESDGSTLSLSGLLNSLDGVAAAEGRLLFATTNHIERLDPALSRPGRMDVWVNFTNATKWQAEGIFKCFFPSAQARADGAAARAADAALRNVPLPRKPASSTHAAPVLSDEEIAVLAKRFADAIPDDEMSVASLQGYLLKNKTRPRESVDEAAEWVVKERETRAKLKKEKEEKEAKEKKEKEEAEAKEKKEKEEAEAKEKAEKEKEERKKARKAAKAKPAESESSSSSSSSSSEDEDDKKEEKEKEKEKKKSKKSKKEKWVAVETPVTPPATPAAEKTEEAAASAAEVAAVEALVDSATTVAPASAAPAEVAAAVPVVAATA